MIFSKMNNKIKSLIRILTSLKQKLRFNLKLKKKIIQFIILKNQMNKIKIKF